MPRAVDQYNLISDYMELFSKICIYTSAILLPIAVLTGLIFLIIKFGIVPLLRVLIDKIYYLFEKVIKMLRSLFDFIVAEILRIADFILNKAVELSVLINVSLIYQHPPQGDVQYITFCCYLAVNTIVLLKRGNVDLNKITSDLKDIAIKKIDNEQNKIKTPDQLSGTPSVNEKTNV